ncbi:alanyl-tRNA editing protein [Halobacteriales archaeon QS_5_70_17]|nr:MAG: alanyl-tRNA editing protein [Halobacteriales archaeon QS_5_70_17]
MTERLYLEDSTVRRFEATVERTLDDRLVLDRTHFYPEGGGQPADRGRIETGDGRLRVVDVQKRDDIYHTVERPGDRPETGGLEGDVDLPAPGTTVTGVLGWERRRAHMCYHTAQHLLSAHLLSAYDAPTVGNQLYDDRARIDAARDRFTEADLEAVAAAVNDLIDDALPVAWYTLDRERAEATLDPQRTRLDLLPDSIRELRIVEIGTEARPEPPADGESRAVYDRTACAGTHVESTDEIGRFRATGRETRGSDAERLSFVLE